MAKTKALISFAVTAKLICVFVFAYAKCRFSHDAAQISVLNEMKILIKLTWNSACMLSFLQKTQTIIIRQIARVDNTSTCAIKKNTRTQIPMFIVDWSADKPMTKREGMANFSHPKN